MLLDRIEEMRKKSYGERRRTTFLVSFSLTAVIALVWGTVILPQTLTLDEVESSRATTASPFKTLADDVGIVFGDIQVGVDQLGKEFGRLWGGVGAKKEEEAPMPASPRDESSAVDITGGVSLPSTDGVDTEEEVELLGEEVINNTETLDETEVELEIEG